MTRFLLLLVALLYVVEVANGRTRQRSAGRSGLRLSQSKNDEIFAPAPKRRNIKEEDNEIDEEPCGKGKGKSGKSTRALQSDCEEDSDELLDAEDVAPGFPDPNASDNNGDDEDSPSNEGEREDDDEVSPSNEENTTIATLTPSNEENTTIATLTPSNEENTTIATLTPSNEENTTLATLGVTDDFFDDDIVPGFVVIDLGTKIDDPSPLNSPLNSPQNNIEGSEPEEISNDEISNDVRG
mmetsp:Transcript_8081/g.13387  ORF Transcript_8081/g.13387 Transcript_8081/m.13387 type:complete len:240 (+) Transcript_8081:121-840(+)